MALLWTQSDIDALKAAILALATGTRVQEVSYSGPPARTVTYHASDLGQMRALLASMQPDVDGEPRYKRLTTHKGFGT